jgi:hypothetical protein
MRDKVVVLDMGIPAFLGNRILDAGFAAKYPGGSVWPIFGKLAEAKGWRVTTADVFLARPSVHSHAVCVSNEAMPANVTALTRLGVEMKIVMSGESPNVTWDFYHEMAERARPFRHAFVFRGFHTRLPQGVEPHVFYWPNPVRRVEGSSWESRQTAVMVVSPKQRIPVNQGRLLSRLFQGWRWMKFHRIQLMDPMLRFPDLYETRMRVLENLAPKAGFRLFGKGWETACRHNRRVRRIAFNKRPEECDDKLTAISSFRFTLCLENCVYPGYLTEKVFDAMRGGTVPVYLGAPDVADFIPSDCFVDLREFCDWDALWLRLVSMTKQEWKRYRDAIDRFLASPGWQPFNEENVARRFAELVT